MVQIFYMIILGLCSTSNNYRYIFTLNLTTSNKLKSEFNKVWSCYKIDKI